MTTRRSSTTLPPMTERALQRAIIEAARLHGWLVHHTRPARTRRRWRTPLHGQAGFPDLVLVRGPICLFVELKSNRGVLSSGQARWLNALHSAGQLIRLWQPDALDAVLAILSEDNTP